MPSEPSDPLATAAASAAAEAKRLRPWVFGLFVLAIVLIVSAIASDGISSTAHLREARAAGEPFEWRDALHAILRQVLMAAPAFALATALWYAQDYLKRLEKGELWTVSTSALVKEIGGSLVTASVLSVAVVPTALGWVEGGNAFRTDLESGFVVLGGLGLALIVIGRVLHDAIVAAGSLKSEHDQIV